MPIAASNTFRTKGGMKMAKKVAVSSVLVTADEEFCDDSHQALMDW